ncbi:MAG: cupin-like domain-containing protein [Acidimicrobiales bacterium]
MVDHLDRCVQSDTAALATQVANGRSVDDAVMRIYLSRLGSTSGLHWDGRPASLLQLDGVKEGILLPPSAADRIDPFPNVDGPNSQLDPFAGTADLEDLDARQFVLCPGDALEMPIGWWHCFRAVTETSTSLSIMWRDR